MSEIVSVDFGKKRNESARRLTRLLGLVEEYEQAVLNDPLPYLEKASREIERLRSVLRAADEALRPSLPNMTEPHDFSVPNTLDTICVRRDEHNRLKAAAAIIRAAGK